MTRRTRCGQLRDHSSEADPRFTPHGSTLRRSQGPELSRGTCSPSRAKSRDVSRFLGAGRARRRWSLIVYRSRKAIVGQAPDHHFLGHDPYLTATASHVVGPWRMKRGTGATCGTCERRETSEIGCSKFRVRSSENLELRTSNCRPSRSSSQSRQSRAFILWHARCPCPHEERLMQSLYRSIHYCACVWRPTCRLFS